MNIPINWNDDAQIRRFFSWSARVGCGPCFGSRPIGWYQAHHCAAHSFLTDSGRRSGSLQVKRGRVLVGGADVGSVADVFNDADRVCRGIAGGK